MEECTRVATLAGLSMRGTLEWEDGEWRAEG